MQENQTRVTREDRDGVAILWLNHPTRSMNTIDEQVFDELRGHVRALAEDESTTAVVLASAKKGSFGAGADVEWLPELAARADAVEFLTEVHDLMYEIVDSAMPYVSAIDGLALGGAFEIVLATHGIIATPRSKLGLPEITLGLIPGGAGTQLLRRWVTTEQALDMLLTGQPVTATRASQLGLVSRIAETHDLIDTAVDYAQRLAAGTEARPTTHEDTDAALAALKHRAAPAAPGATKAILTVVGAGVTAGPAAGCAAERQAFLSLIPSQEAKALIHLFTTESAIKRRSRGQSEKVSRLAIVGGGQMGSGIAATAVTHGINAVVRDVTEDQLDRSRSYLDRVLARRPDESASQRWSSTTAWTGFDSAQAVIEAVFELPDLKRETLSQVEAAVGPDTLIATNTSAIPIESLASALTRPTRFLGMHFFSPVERMPLVELIPHSETSEDTVARASALARSLGKIPVVVADRPGFFTSRVYARWLIEAIRLLLDGATPEAIEAGSALVGFPVGPLQAHDEATLDLVEKASIAQVAEKVMANRLDVDAVRATLRRLIDAGVEGRRQGAGFYEYIDGKRTRLNPRVRQAVGSPESGISPTLAGERLLLAFASECFLCWEDGTLRSPDDGDIASVLGIGFPRKLGGPFHWADETGLEEVRDRCAALGDVAFPVGERLVQLAESGSQFSDEPRR